MLDAGRPGWVLALAAIGIEPGSVPTADYSALQSQGLGVVVRINHGYGTTGTLPLPHLYPVFAQTCAAFVARSRGCHLWIIGNEPNHRQEWPQGQPIYPDLYARAYTLCRQAIRAVPGHGSDRVLLAGPAPWNPELRYPANPLGDWVKYFQHQIAPLGEGACDGFALHTYTHTLDVNQIRGDFYHGAPGYQHLRNEFRSYRDWMEAIPPRFRQLPVLITETDPTEAGRGWEGGPNIGWVRAAYDEIAAWNADPAHQPIQALLLYRWPPPEQHGQWEWSIANRPGIIDDFRQALRATPAERYRTRVAAEPAAFPEPEPELAPAPFTNQQLIRAFAAAAKELGLGSWELMRRAGIRLGDLTRERNASYRGGAIETLPGLSETQRQLVLHYLREPRRVPYTNQQIITALHNASLKAGLGAWVLLYRAGLDLNELARDRQGPYLGPSVDELPNLTAAERELVRDELPDRQVVSFARAAPAEHLQQEPALALPELEMPEAAHLPRAASGNTLETRVVQLWNRYGWLLLNVADVLGLDEGVAVALLANEGELRAFDSAGHLRIRFEVPIFWDVWGEENAELFAAHFRFDEARPWQGHRWRAVPDDKWQDVHQSQTSEWGAFRLAATLNPQAAAAATALGLPQIMGFAYDVLGYRSPAQMMERFAASEREQLLAYFELLAGTHAPPRQIEALRAGDFTTFAALHFGASRAARQAHLLSRAYDRLPPAARGRADGRRRTTDDRRPTTDDG